MGSSMQDFASVVMHERQEYLRKQVADGGHIDLSKFPGADFFYKMVAKVDSGLYSIYDAGTEYKLGQIMHQPVKPNKEAGYFVYRELE